MAPGKAVCVTHRGWFQLLPPEDSGADYYFKTLRQLLNFAEACGWIVKEVRSCVRKPDRGGTDRRSR